MIELHMPPSVHCGMFNVSFASYHGSTMLFADYLNRCQPGGTMMVAGLGQPVAVNCTGPFVTSAHSTIDDGHWSFPSGHSSMSYCLGW